GDVPMFPVRWIALVLLMFCELTVVPAQENQELKPLAISSEKQVAPQQIGPQVPTGEPAFAQPRRLLQQGKYDEAVAQLQALAAKNSKVNGLSHELGIAYYKMGDYEKAIERLKKALEEDPQDNEAVQLLGLSYYFTGRAGEATPLLAKVQSWYPRANVDAAYMLGMCYVQTRNYAQARHAFATM